MTENSKKSLHYTKTNSLNINNSSKKAISNRLLYKNNIEKSSSLHLFLLKIKVFLFGYTLEKSKYTEKTKKEIYNQIKLPIRLGLIAILITFTFFIIWSSLAPLDSASIAEGYITLGNHKKEIFYEGGNVVEKILIRDGEKVKKHQPLIILNQYKAKAQLENDLWHLRYAIISEKKFTHCLEVISHYQNFNKDTINNSNIKFYNKYLDNNDKKVFQLIKAQKNSFISFKSYIENSIQSFTTQINQTYSEILSLKERIKSYKANVIILEKEYKRKKSLHKKKLETTERLSHSKLDLQRYKGQVLEDEARLNLSKHKIIDINVRRANFLDEQNFKLLEEYKRNYTELLRLEAAYINSKDVHKRTTIIAPNDGVVTGLNIHTAGSTLRQDGKPILEIIPQDDNLIVETFIPSQEIDSINVGGNVKIQLNAYKARLVPRIIGKVFYISADKFDHQNMSGSLGQHKLAPIGFYKAKIEIKPDELTKINADIKLYPGMPVTVFLIKGTRSLAQYLYSPIKDSFHRAFKEP